MPEDYYLLNDAAQILGRKPHHLAYALTTGKVAEPILRVANKRVFTRNDINHLARHFQVTPKWPICKSETNASEDLQAPEGLVLKRPFEVLQSGTNVYEVRDDDGEVFCWATDRARALIIAGLLESACC